jgi:3-oxoacyl-[acyl-carrier-protein] synthase II
MRPRVVITGLGIVSAAGRDPQAVLESFRQGRGGIGPVRAFDTTGFTTRHAAEVPDFDPLAAVGADELGTVDRASQMALVAARQALADARLDLAALPRDRVALAVGMSGAGQFQNFRFTLARQQVVSKEAAFFVDRNLPHFQADFVSGRLGLTGPRVTFVAASAGSGLALGQAVALLRAGKVDVALAGGAEGHTLGNAIGMESLGVASPRPCSPFSDSPGITFGEGAAYLVLESLEHARQRGAPICAELLGWGTSIDGYDPISNDPSGAGMYRAMSFALQDAGVAREELSWIKASGTGNREQDLAETLAIRQLFDEAAAVPPVSSLEPYFGHINGASPALGLLGAVLCQGADLIPATLNFGEPRRGCDLDYVPNQARQAPIRSCLCNAMAFGGLNASFVVGPLQAEPRPAPPPDRVVITGLGIVSPLGCDLESFLAGLSRPGQGIVPIERFDTAGCRARRAGLVREFDARRLVPSAEVRRADLMVQYAAAAARLALKDAGLEGGGVPEERLGVVVGLTRGPEGSYTRFFENLCKNPLSPATGRLLLRMGRFAVASHLAQALNLKGISATLSDGVTAGLHALAHAYELLRGNPLQDAVVVVAADEVGALFFRLLDAGGVLAPGEAGPAPYDPSAPGMVLGEGAAAVVLERASSARRRGARAWAEFVGYGLAAGDEALERAGRLALAEADLQGPPELAYGHGRGLPAEDSREAQAWARLLGERVPIGCVLGCTGVAEAASGLYSTVAAAVGLARGEAYPLATAGALPDGLSFVRGGVRPGPYRNTLVLGGTGQGNCAAVVLRRAE